jgi:hypothetical protein
MEQLVVVRAEGQGRFTAQALGVPDVKGTGATEAEAVEQVRQALAAWLVSGKVVRVDVPLPGRASIPVVDSSRSPHYDLVYEQHRLACEEAIQSGQLREMMENRVRPTIHFSELGPLPAGSPISQEWEFYRREVGRLIAVGHEGKWVLIKGEQILGLFDTRETAMGEGRMRSPMPGEPFLVTQILTHEPITRVSAYLRPCPTSR